MGVVIRYQGFLCNDVQFVRSRGIMPDSFWVTITFVRSFPESFEVRAPLADEPLVLPPNATTTTGGVVEEAPTELNYAGDLYLQQDGFPPLRISNVYVRQVLEVLREREDIPGRKSSLKLVLSDVRMLYGLGVVRDSESEDWLPRWSFNRLQPDGAYALDSVQDNGQPWTLRQVLSRFVVGSLPASPKLARLPAREAFDKTADLQYEPFEPPALALQRAVDDYRTADPCLALNGALALYEDGEGRVGYSVGEGVENTEDVPPQFHKTQKLQGKSNQAEFSYPPQYALVVGGKAIATAAVDRWEFVLQINGRFFPLSDETVVKLTGDERLGLDWLSRWILSKPEHKRSANLPEKIATLLDQQAWTLVRLPLVEVERKLDAPADAQGAASGDPVAGASPPETELLPGPYAHLLPLLPQGKSQGGKRVPVEVQAYGYGVRHFTHGEAPELQRLKAAAAAKAAAEEGIWSELNGTSPLRLRPPVSMFDAWLAGKDAAQVQELSVSGAGIDDVWQIVRQEGGVNERGQAVLPFQVNRYLRHLRQVAVLRADRPDLAGVYEAAQVAFLRAQDEAALSRPGNIPPRQEKLWEIAKEILAFEDNLKKQQVASSNGITVVVGLARDPRNRALKDDLRRKVAKLVREIANDRVERQALVAAGGGETLPGQQVQIVVNEGRATDTGARVFDAELGVVKLSRRAGWVEDPVIQRAELGPVHNVSPGAFNGARFRPQPVRVIFGHELRPRIDVAYGTPVEVQAAPRPITGLDPAKQATVEPDVVRSAESDDATWYRSCWRRDGSGQATPILPSLATDPLVVRRRDLVELIDLEGESNRAKLDELARDTSASRFGVRSLVRGESVPLIGLWPVNCDGVVAHVQITTVKGPSGGPAGFQTTVTTGGRKTLEAVRQGATRVRPRPVVDPDATARGRLAK